MMRRKTQTLCSCRLLCETDASQRWRREDHARYPGVVRRVPIALQQIASDDAPLHASDGCEWEAATGNGISCRIHGLVGHALQVLVDGDAVFLACNPRHL